MTIRTDIPEFTTDAAGNLHVNFPAGAKRNHWVNVTDENGAAQNMTGWSLAYVWRDVRGAIVFSKATGGSGITIGNGAGTNDRATTAIDAADTQGLAGEYSWALWRTDSTNDDPLAVGTVYVSPIAAQP